MLIGSTPNIEGLDNRVVPADGERLLAHGICPPAHVNGFSRPTLHSSLLLCNFDVIGLHAEGQFDVNAFWHYLESNKCDEYWSEFKNLVANCDHHRLQQLINSLDASSAMLFIARKAQ
jgi:hypothetical protein